MPTVNLNEKSIKAIKPGKRRADYFDSENPGLCLRVSRTGRKTWCFMFRHAGRFQRMSLGTYPATTLKEARKKARGARHDSEHGINPAVAKKEAREADTFKELAGEYLERHAKVHKKSWEEDRRIINVELLPRFGPMKARDVARRDVRAMLDEIVDRDAPILANRVKALMSKIYNWGIGADIVQDNPAAFIPAPAKARQRDRVLNEEEIKRLWAELPNIRPPSPMVLRLILLTAQRPGEVRAAEWREIDLEAGWWVLPGEKTKNRLQHRVPLSKPALSMLKGIKRRQETKAARKKRPMPEYVFPARRGKAKHITTVQKAVETIRATGIDFTAHDLRRTAASHMTGLGVPRLVVGKILNHVEPGVTAVYDRHSYDKEKREALDLWGRKVMAMVTGMKAVKRETGA